MAVGAAKRRLKHPYVLAEPLDFGGVPVGAKFAQYDSRSGRLVVGINETVGARFPEYGDGVEVGSVLDVRPVDESVQMARGVVERSALKSHFVGEELHRQTSETLRTGHGSAEAWGGWRVGLVRRADTHPVVVEVLLGHAVAIVGDDYAVVGEFDSAVDRVGVVGVLDELRQCDVRTADQAVAQFSQERDVDGEGGGLHVFNLDGIPGAG